MHFKISSAICFHLNQSGNELTIVRQQILVCLKLKEFADNNWLQMCWNGGKVTQTIKKLKEKEILLFE